MKKFIKSYFKMFLIFFLAFSTAMGASYKLFETKNKREAAVKVQESKPVASEKVATTTEKQPKPVVEEVRQAAVTTTTSTATSKATVPTATAVAPTTKATSSQPNAAPTTPPAFNIYTSLHLDEAKVIKNSNKFTVTLDKTSVKIGDNIKFTVRNVPKNSYIMRAEHYGKQSLSGSNGQWIDDNTYQDTIVVQNWETAGNTIQSYIFVKPSNETSYYEYDFTLTK